MMLEGLFEGVLSPHLPSVRSKNILLDYLTCDFPLRGMLPGTKGSSFRDIGLLPFLMKEHSSNWISRRAFSAFALLHVLNAPLLQMEYHDKELACFAVEFVATCQNLSIHPGSLLHTLSVDPLKAGEWQELFHSWKDTDAEHRPNLFKAATVAASVRQAAEMARYDESQLAKVLETASALKSGNDAIVLSRDLSYYSPVLDFWHNRRVCLSLVLLLQVKEQRFYLRKINDQIIKDAALVLANAYGSFTKLMDLARSKNLRMTICHWLED